MREELSPVISGESGRRPPPRHFAPRGRTSPYSPEMTGGTYIYFAQSHSDFSQLRDVIHGNLAYLEGHESSLNTAGGIQRGWSELSRVVIFHHHLRARWQHQNPYFQQVLNFPFKKTRFSITTSEPAASLKTHTFQQVLNFPFKKTRFSITTSQHQTYTNWNHRRFLCLCVCACPSQTTNGLPCLPPPRTRKAMRKRDWEKNNWRAQRQLLVFGPNAILVLVDRMRYWFLWTESDL